jgi:hypothetical protein
MRPYLKKPFTKKGLVEWLKVKALSSSPSTERRLNDSYLSIDIQTHGVELKVQK